MKHYSVLLIFTFLLVSCYQVERNCTDYKTGKFSFNYSVDGIEKTGTLVRTESYNIDYYENIADSASIRWINDWGRRNT